MKLSENFSLEELIASDLARQLGIANIPQEQTIAKLAELCRLILQPIRDKFHKPIKVTSGYRSKSLNKSVGGSSSSQHLKGEAADIVADNNRILWNLIVEMIRLGEITVGQLIDEKNLRWIHISLPSGSMRNQILKL